VFEVFDGGLLGPLWCRWFPAAAADHEPMVANLLHASCVTGNEFPSSGHCIVKVPKVLGQGSRKISCHMTLLPATTDDRPGAATVLLHGRSMLSQLRPVWFGGLLLAVLRRPCAPRTTRRDLAYVTLVGFQCGDPKEGMLLEFATVASYVSAGAILGVLGCMGNGLIPGRIRPTGWN
jgi:hypothetical protein